jgi:hypothetical protein
MPSLKSCDLGLIEAFIAREAADYSQTSPKSKEWEKEVLKKVLSTIGDQKISVLSMSSMANLGCILRKISMDILANEAKIEDKKLSIGFCSCGNPKAPCFIKIFKE